MVTSKKSLISIIIPVYETDEHLSRCLDSIEAQTYQNLEIIIVADAVKFPIENIVKKYKNTDNRIQYISCSAEEDLVAYAVYGAAKAAGDYISIVDSGDYISCDYYRLLLKKAMETDADMVLADLSYESERIREYLNMDSIRLQDLQLEGTQVRDSYERQESYCYSWKFVGNKLYKRTLWQNCVSALDKLKNSKLKSEAERETSFSNILWFAATKVCNVHHAEYFYCRNTGLLEKDFFYSIKTPLGKAFDDYEKIKKIIVDMDYVSFDVFDTVILRPFWQPEDLFYLLNDFFMDIAHVSSDVDFSAMRTMSEHLCREELRKTKSTAEDITLDAIYEKMRQIYALDADVCNLMKEKELEYELRFCQPRKTGRELYELALSMGKKVIFVSDMYLSEETITQMLYKCGYISYEKLYVSSEIRLGKWTGHLFEYVLKNLKIQDASKVVHIGDNLDSDVKMPRKCNINSCHLDKPVSVFTNSNKDIWAGEAFSQAVVHNDSGRDLSEGLRGFVGFRTAAACVANKIFDNPYVSFHEKSDFNANPYYVGYYALGMHLFAVVQWLKEELEGAGRRTIHFVARDGYIVKNIYDLLAKSAGLPQSNYLYLSRKALALADIERPVDLYSITNKLNIRNYSPHKFLGLFDKMADAKVFHAFEADMKKEGWNPDKKFSKREEFEEFLTLFIEKVWEDIQWDSYQKMLYKYFSGMIKKEDVLFDIGYSGRCEMALKHILGYAPDSYYIHSNSDMLNRRSRRNGFKTKLFYNYKPCITGVMREQMFSRLAPSTIGYETNQQGSTEPVFEEYTPDYPTEFVTGLIQKGAMDFAQDMIELFGEDVDKLYARREDMSQPFEYYLHYGKTIDRNIFSSLMFEDEFGEGKKVPAVSFWARELNRINQIQIPVTTKHRIAEKKHPAMFRDLIDINRDEDAVKFLKCANNTSNLVAWSAIDRIIHPEYIDNWYVANSGGFADGEYKVFLTTNLVFIQENADLSYMDEVLDKIEDKILLPLSVGLSCEVEKKSFYLNAQAVKVLQRIAERCKSIGVRGEYTAEILSGYGIKNSCIVGCPSLYENMEQMKRISHKASAVRNISGSFKPFYGRFTQKEKQLFKYMAENNFKLTETTALNLTSENVGTELFKQLSGYEKKKKLYFDVRQWRKSFEKADFAMGMNFHDNVLAMQSGVPALFVNYETSSREMCKYFQLPYIEASEFDSNKDVRAYYEMADYKNFLNGIEKKYRNFADFLKDNEVLLESRS